MTKNKRYQMIGTTDDVVDCERCGKPDLRMTVVLEMLDRDGNSEGITYYGSTCAARALADRGERITAAKIRDRAIAAQRERERRAQYALECLQSYNLPVVAGPVDPDVWAAAVSSHATRNAVCFRNNPHLTPQASLTRCVTGWWSDVTVLALEAA